MKGNKFEELFLVIKKPKEINFTTIFIGGNFSLHIMPFIDGFPSARIVSKEMKFKLFIPQIHALI